MEGKSSLTTSPILLSLCTSNWRNVTAAFASVDHYIENGLSPLVTYWIAWVNDVFRRIDILLTKISITCTEVNFKIRGLFFPIDSKTDFLSGGGNASQ